MATMSFSDNSLKMAAALAAVDLVADGMIVGLGTGSTASLAIRRIGERVARGLQITGIPTSRKTAELAESLNIPLASLGEHDHVDLTIDGADEVEAGTLHLIKGRGGALLHEKIVACASRRLVIIVDESKLVRQLGADQLRVPLEVIPFGWQATAGRLRAIGADFTVRQTAQRQPFVTDSGHYILDCAFLEIKSLESLQQQLDGIVGVVEHGLFLGLASEVIVGRAGGVETLRPISSTGTAPV